MQEYYSCCDFFNLFFSDCYTWMIVQPTYTLQGLHTAHPLLPDSQKHGQLPNSDRFYAVMSNGAWQGIEVNNTSWMHSKPFWRRLHQPCPSGDFLNVCQSIDWVLRDICYALYLQVHLLTFICYTWYVFICSGVQHSPSIWCNEPHWRRAILQMIAITRMVE